VPQDGGCVRLQGGLCIGCGNRVEACPFGAVFWEGDRNKLQICVHCGYCARYCAYDVILLEENEEVHHVAQ
jgi:Fe-S-cluster-containing hydrogenase component 2